MDPRELILSAEIESEKVFRYLASRGFADPERADQDLQRITETVGLPERVANLLPALLTSLEASVDANVALSHFESFLEAVPSQLNLLSLLEGNPRSLDILTGILGASPFLTHALLRNPEYFYWLIENKRLETVCDKDYFRRVATDAVRPFDDRTSALNALRRLRRREALRIGAQDILGILPMVQIVSQVSSLADSLLHKVFELLAAELLPEPKGFAVLGMGKLGGGELNFSSDVDLIYIFHLDEQRDLMHRFAREYSKALTEFSPEGHLYRVDLRLRPMGKGGEIAYSEKASRQYYQTWGDTSDRLAMLKCRAVAGDAELGERFVSFVQEVVYKRYLDFAAVEEIRWIKNRTDRDMARRKESLTNIKLGLGGIREIEFFVQSFQILYGGSQPEIRSPNTLIGLQKLVDFGFIPLDDFHKLREAYVFMRDLEHKLQLVHDLQTHSLPGEMKELVLCARRMGYRSLDGDAPDSVLSRFQGDLEAHNRSVRRIFESLLTDRDSYGGLEELVLNPAIDRAEAIQRLEAISVGDAEGVFDGLTILLEAPAYPHSPTRVRNLLANLVQPFVEHSRLAIEPRQLFTRVDRFCEALGSRASLYTELNENEQFTGRFLRLMAASPPLAETLIQNTELLDAFAQPVTLEDYASRLGDFVSSQAERQIDSRDALRMFKRREEFKIGTEEFFAPGDPENRRRLSRLAEAGIAWACNRSFELHPWVKDAPFCILGLGKLGGEELIFHSDLDLVFLFDDRMGGPTGLDFRHFLKSFRDELQLYTAQGSAWEVDFRLRPEGRHTAEAVPISQLETYFETRCEAWERLAYVKARPIFKNHLDYEIAGLLSLQPITDEDRQQLMHIRQRKEKEIGREDETAFNLKVGRGALLDVQFIVQYLQLKHQIISANTLQALNKLRNISPELSLHPVLEEALSFFFKLESVQDLRGVSEPDRISTEAEENRQLALLVGETDPQAFLSRYREVAEAVRGIYLETFAS